MRGKLAKLLRKNFTEDGVLDEKKYRTFKKAHKLLRQMLGNQPNLPKRTRWERSPLRRARAPLYSGIYFGHVHPVREMWKLMNKVDEVGQNRLLNLAKIAGRIPKPVLLDRIEMIKELHGQEVRSESN